MSAISNSNANVEFPTERRRSPAGRAAHAAGRGLLKLLAGLAVALAMVPVALLPFATAVPWYGWLALALADIGLLALLIGRAPALGHKALLFAAVVAVSILAVLLSQWFAATPPITGADGRVVPGSIATLERVELNGSDQWITIRGHDQTRPVLLFLAGGPGGSQLAATRKMLGELEQHFVVVNWEQPGAGKSYHAVDIAALTPERYVDDGIALTIYLRQRFNQDKIYVLGESWGSILGVWLAQRRPEMFHAFAGSAQMVDFLETDTYCYFLALQLAFESGDFQRVQSLMKQEPPPYYGKGVARKAAAYLMYLSGHMNRNPAITGPGYDTIGDIAAPEYGLYDKVNYARGLLDTMDVLWPQLWEVNLREDAPRLDVPVYFLEGRHDVNAPPALVEDYAQRLDAPHKEIIWFEHSGHSPWVDESGRFVDVMVNTVLGDTARR